MLLRNNIHRLSPELSLFLYDALVSSFDVADRIYVNSSGSDVSGDGSKENPYASLDHVKTLSLDGKAIILEAEEYVTSWCQDYVHQWRVIGQPYAGATIIGKAYGTVIVPDTPVSARDGVFLGSNGTTTVYGIHFKKDNGGTTTNYNTAICSNGGGSSTSTYPSSYMTAINCVFEELNPNGNLSLSYLANFNEYTFNHCSFIAGNWLSNYNGSGYLTFNNCAFTGTPNFGSATRNSTIENVTFNDLEHIQENAGVYSGPGKWAEDKPAREVLIESFPESDRIYVETTGSDTTGDGSEENPYQSFDYVRSILSSSNPKCIIFGEGDFPLTTIQVHSAHETFIDERFDGSVLIGSFENKTKLYNTNDLGLNAMHVTRINDSSAVFKAYGIHFERNNGNRQTGTWRVSLFNGGAGQYFYNCVFSEVSSGQASLFYGNTVYWYNCFSDITNWTSSYSSGSGSIVKDCAFTSPPNLGSATTSNNVNNVTVDGDYHITNGGFHFDGSGDYLKADTALDVFTATNDVFCFDMIITSRDVAASDSVIGCNTVATGSNTFLFSQTSLTLGNGDNNVLSPAMTANQKQYVAIQYDGSDFSVYINGTRALLDSDTLDTALADCVFGIGCEFDAANGGTPGNYFDGIIHQLRLRRHAPYSGTTISPPSDLAIDGHTEFLLDGSKGLNDQSGSNHFVSFYGDTFVYNDARQGVYSGIHSWHGYPVRQSIMTPFPETDRIYIAQNGSDVTGDGSENSPYASIDHALSEQGAPGKVLIMGSGTFPVTPHSSVYVRTILGTQFDGMTVIGIPGQTIIQSSYTYTGGSHDYASFIGPGNNNSAFHWLIVERDNAGTTTNYKCPLISNDGGAPALGAAYNCAFKELNANGNISLGYNNGNNSDFTLHNCSIIASNWLSPYSGTSGLRLENCAFTGAPNYGSASQIGGVQNIRIGADYAYAEQHGVYAGLYSWNGFDLYEQVGGQPGVFDLSSVTTTISTGGYADGNRTNLMRIINLEKMTLISPHVAADAIIMDGSNNNVWLSFDNSGDADSDRYFEFQFRDYVALKSFNGTGTSGSNRGNWKWQYKDASGIWHDASNPISWDTNSGFSFNDGQISGVSDLASNHWRLIGVSATSPAGGYYLHEFTLTYKEMQL